MTELVRSEDYRQWIASIKQRVQSAQIKASVAVNREMLELYWFLGEKIIEKQKIATWSDGFLKQMSLDLLDAFPSVKGFSYRNLKYMRQWVQYWSVADSIGQQVVAQNAKQLIFQIPWGHNLVLLDKFEHANDALFYVQKTIENNWSRSVLTHQIESGLHLREGKATSNFAATLPTPNFDVAQQMLRDPYQFDFLTPTKRFIQRESENGLVEHLIRPGF